VVAVAVVVVEVHVVVVGTAEGALALLDEIAPADPLHIHADPAVPRAEAHHLAVWGQQLSAFRTYFLVLMKAI
jgi:hypothetical protein